jgi:hypothetical protein
VLKPSFFLSLIGLQLEVTLRYANRVSTQKQQAATEGGTAMFPTNHFWCRSIRRSTAFCVYPFSLYWCNRLDECGIADPIHEEPHQYDNRYIDIISYIQRALLCFRLQRYATITNTERLFQNL